MEWLVIIPAVLLLVVLLLIWTAILSPLRNPAPSELENEEGEKVFKEFMESQGLDGTL